jgi:hypothetical protein
MLLQSKARHRCTILILTHLSVEHFRSCTAVSCISFAKHCGGCCVLPCPNPTAYEGESSKPFVLAQDGINGVYLGRDVVNHAGAALTLCLRKVSACILRVSNLRYEVWKDGPSCDI